MHHYWYTIVDIGYHKCVGGICGGNKTCKYILKYEMRTYVIFVLFYTLLS